MKGRLHPPPCLSLHRPPRPKPVERPYLRQPGVEDQRPAVVSCGSAVQSHPHVFHPWPPFNYVLHVTDGALEWKRVAQSRTLHLLTRLRGGSERRCGKGGGAAVYDREAIFADIIREKKPQDGHEMEREANKQCAVIERKDAI